MSDSVRPQRQQPTRLPSPWDSPSRNTGVGCHCLLQYMKVKVKSLSRVRLSDPMDYSLPGSSIHGIFQARVLEWGARLHIFYLGFNIFKNVWQILKAAREKQQTHKGIPIRITADLSTETLQARREWQDILKVMKENNLQPRLLYPARISFKYEGEIKSFTDKQKLREFSTTKPALQQMLKDLL